MTYEKYLKAYLNKCPNIEVIYEIKYKKSVKIIIVKYWSYVYGASVTHELIHLSNPYLLPTSFWESIIFLCGFYDIL